MIRRTLLPAVVVLSGVLAVPSAVAAPRHGAPAADPTRYGANGARP
jgi:hypothetical protein